ncbi:MAG: prolyl oligopeptidase family serine peptidase [Acidobacteria bacterium]|nr:prolyl oligopeptidase family serine peptidase [Acidobacteriota bacterium]
MKPTLLAFALLAPAIFAQGTRADYDRANALREKLQGTAIDLPGTPTWIGESNRFWYRKTVKGGHEFILVDAEKGTRQPAFDHARIAAALGPKYKPETLPFAEFAFADGDKAITFSADSFLWKCTLADSACVKTGPAPQGGGRGGRGGRGGGRGPIDEEPAPAEFANNVTDGMAFDPSPQALPAFTPFTAPPTPTIRTSPDEKWDAFIENFNVFLRPHSGKDATPLSWDGSEGNYYTFASLAWSGDSKFLVAYRVRTAGFKREVHYVESSPADQLQPKHSSREYSKPGDVLDISQPVLFDVAAHRQIEIDHALFPNPYSLSRPQWWKDSRAFTFEYNQRGHQLYRVIEVDTAGHARALISEECPTFIDYRPLVNNPRDTGKKVRFDLADGKEILWASERDGWEHLYLYDGITGQVKRQITRGNWVVRAVDKVDEEKRQIWFAASGMNPAEDPYYVHYYRIGFDGTGLVSYTEAAADHAVVFSPDRKYYVDTYSRVDLPTVSELRRTEDRAKVMDLEKADPAAALAAGWKFPEPFHAPGRDGKTEIYGVIYRPTNFDPAKRYPVVENIYNGPQGSFVPKDFAVAPQPLAELGFIVVQIDGMGTNNRSRAFHDVAWHDLGDAGFPDRIAWHKAVAAKYPWYDITRVGIYGTSAGAQNSLGALLFHPDFYKAAVSNSGCHDNRMDKIWWNEQWMGWPLGPQYAASSNVDNAYRLQGDLLLVVGELDTNVDPASTFQVVNQLIRHDKKFDLLFVPGGGHGAGGAYGQHLLQDFFVHHLLKVEPPDWNHANASNATGN